MTRYLDPRKRLVLSLFAGLLAVVIMWTYLAKERKKINNLTKMTTVLITKRYVAPGKSISADFLEEIPIPVAYVEPTAIQTIKDLGNGNRKARLGLLKGEQLTKSKLSDENISLGLSWVLPPDQTALTLKFSLAEAVGGFLRPGDWVNVYSTMNNGTRILLPRVRAVAVQDQIADDMGATAEKNIDKNMSNDFVLVTLALTSTEATQAILAQQKGTLYLSLCSSMKVGNFK
jgi:pilus assembly protein CpaB